MPRMNKVTKKFVINNDTPRFATLTAPAGKRKIVTEIRSSVSPGETPYVSITNPDGMGPIEFFAAPGYSPPWKGLDLLPPSNSADGDLRVQVQGLTPGQQIATIEVDYLVEL